jgi:hypothetical protein
MLAADCVNIGGMQREGMRHCDGCGQPLPPKAMMGRQTVSKEEARVYGSECAAGEVIGPFLDS